MQNIVQNTSIPNTADIVIIGGGVMGASAAYHLAKAGIKNIVLLEKEEFYGQGATGRCAGGVRYQFATEVNIKLSLASLPMLDNFEEELGYPIDYQKIGYLFLLSNEKDIKKFENNVNLQHKLGVETEWLSGDEIRLKLPQMNLEDILKGTINRKDGLVDPNGVVMGYIQAAQKLGVKCISSTTVNDIKLKGNQVTKVITNRGEISTSTVINCAGPWAAKIGEMAGINIPIKPVRRQMLVTTPLPELASDFPFVIDFSQSLYFHPEGEGLLTGMSNPDQAVGYDQSVDTDFELINLEKSIARMPMLEKAGLASHWAGLYEITPDAHPIYGKTPIDGLFLVGGFSGHGFMHGPISGKLITEIIMHGEASSVDVSMLNYDRFSNNNLIFEYNVV